MTTRKPDLPDATIKDFLSEHYGLQVAEITFLPIGYELTAVYHVATEDRASYFLKLKCDLFDKTSVSVPTFLHARGVQQIIVPVATRNHQLWSQLDDFHVILYPFMEGHNAFKTPLTAHQWIDFGAALKGIHTVTLPSELQNHIPRETYSPQWREMLMMLQDHAENDTFDDPVARQLAAFMINKAVMIRHMVARAEQLSVILQTQVPEFVLCHSDIHAGNILVDMNENLYIIDWDNPILAAKERDLMFIGGGIGGNWNTTAEEAQFYKGYGHTEINAAALVYYRFERIIQDVAPRVEQLLLTNTGADRPRILQGIKDWFLPNRVVEMAYKAETTLPSELA